MGAPKKPGKKTVVVGGGNTAIDAARCARRLGADVVILYRRSRGDMPAIANEIEDALEEGVEFKFFATPIGIKEKNGALSSLRCIEMKPGKPDDSGRRRPEPIEDSEFSLEADTIITAVGESAAFSFFDLFENDENLPLHIDAWGCTSRSNLFVCGDAGPNTRTVAHAIGSGKRTAMRMNAFLGDKEIHTTGENSASVSHNPDGQEGDQSVVRPEDINLDYFTKARPLCIEKTSGPDRLNGFEEIHSTIGAAAILQEAERCFSCGFCNKCGTCFVFCPDMSVVLSHEEDLPDFIGDYCKGCGICARECPRGIIHMVEEKK
jgi:NADPH-dependent glutamate synthase beta subunit-like oxidoreductase